MKNKVYIFTECGKKAGFGHVVRCMALYDEFVECGYLTQFVIASDINVASLLGNRNYYIADWHNSVVSDEGKGCYAIIDSYLAPIEKYEEIAKIFDKVLYIDDYNRLDYPSGIILNPNIGAEFVAYSTDEKRSFLGGEEFVILRKEFRGTNFHRQRNTDVKNILVLLGGSDACDLTTTVLEILCKEKYRSYKKHVVIGMPDKKFSDAPNTRLCGLDKEITFYYCLNAQELVNLMVFCDLAISAAGQTTNELIAIELPFICIQVAENQKNNVKALEEKGIIREFFDYSCKYYFDEWLSLELDRMIENLKLRTDISEKMKNMKIKKGVNRILDILLEEK